MIMIEWPLATGITAQEMIDEKQSGHWTRHAFDSREDALQVLDQLVAQGLEVSVSVVRGTWYLILS